MQESELSSESEKDIAKNVVQSEYQKRTDMIIRYLRLETDKRSKTQQKLLQSYFEKYFTYFENLKGNLNEDLYLYLFATLEFEETNPFDVVFHQGETGRKMYFILNGECAILLKVDHLIVEAQTRRKAIRTFEDLMKYQYFNQKCVAIKHAQDYFGEIAIEQRIPRTATVLCKTKCQLAILTYDSYQNIISTFQSAIIKMKYEILQSIHPFCDIDESQLHYLVHICEEINLQSNTLLYKRFQYSDFIYAIISGEILVQRWEKTAQQQQKYFIFDRKEIVTNLGLYGRGQIIGDYELFIKKLSGKGVIRVTQATTKETTRILKIPIQQFLQFIKDQMPFNWLEGYFDQKYKNKKWLKQIPTYDEEQEKLKIEQRNRTTTVLMFSPKGSSNKLIQVKQSMQQEENKLQLLNQKKHPFFQPPLDKLDFKHNKTLRRFLNTKDLKQEAQKDLYFATNSKISIDNIRQKVYASKLKHLQESSNSLEHSQQFISSSTLLRTEPNGSNSRRTLQSIHVTSVNVIRHMSLQKTMI